MATKSSPASGGQTKDKEIPRARSFMRNDFPAIRKASSTLLACVVVGAGMVSGSGYMLEKQLAARDAMQPIANQAREKYSQAETEKREIHDFQPKYMQLVDKGFVGDEKRLDWIESIKNIQQHRGLPPLSYEISPQQAFLADPEVETGALELHGSRMLLKMNLLHEMDMLNFFDDLQEKHFYSLHDCNIKRAKFDSRDPLVPRLYAECSLFWITLGKSVAAGELPPAAPTTN